MSCEIGGVNVTVESGTCDEANNLYNAIVPLSVISGVFFLIFAVITLYYRKNLNNNLKNNNDESMRGQMGCLLFLCVGAFLCGIIAGVLSFVLNANISEPVGGMYAGWILGGFSLTLVLGWLIQGCSYWCLKNYPKYTNLLNKNPAGTPATPGYRAARFDVA